MSDWSSDVCSSDLLALPGVLGGQLNRERAIARTEAIASWTEMIRDSIVAASGLEEAIVATAPVAPTPLASEVRTLFRRLHDRKRVVTGKSTSDRVDLGGRRTIKTKSKNHTN